MPRPRKEVVGKGPSFKYVYRSLGSGAFRRRFEKLLCFEARSASRWYATSHFRQEPAESATLGFQGLHAACSSGFKFSLSAILIPMSSNSWLGEEWPTPSPATSHTTGTSLQDVWLDLLRRA